MFRPAPVTCLAIAILLPAMAPTTASAQTQTVAEPQDNPVQSQLRQMQQQLDGLRLENQTMKGEIDELRAASNEDWLTEARADEIRGLVADVLADSDTRASLLQDGLVAGWSDHFFLADPYGRFKLVLEGQMQIRWVYNYRERGPQGSSPFGSPDQQDQHRQGFENTRSRLTFSGHVFNPDWEYLLRLDAFRIGGAIGLLDAWVRYNFNDNWSLRFGQFKVPFNREELVSSQYQLAVERSLVNEAMTLGRSQGIELTYHDDQNRFSLATTDGGTFGPFLTQGLGGPSTNTSATAADSEYDATVRYEYLEAGTWNQFEDFTSPRDDQFGMLWGIAIHAEQTESDGIAPFGGGQESVRFLGGTADLSLEWGGANAFVSGTYYYIDTPGAILQMVGIVAQAGVYISPKTELFVRGEFMQAELTSTIGPGGQFNDLNLITAGFNYYLEGHDLKWTTDLGVAISDVDGAFVSDLAGYRIQENDTAPQVVFRTQFQLLF